LRWTLALDGMPREEADRFLSHNFDLEDRRGLLDETYQKLEHEDN
jgi:hypothetical protein